MRLFLIILVIATFNPFSLLSAQSLKEMVDEIIYSKTTLSSQNEQLEGLKMKYEDSDSLGFISYFIAYRAAILNDWKKVLKNASEAEDFFSSVGYKDYRKTNCFYRKLQAYYQLGEFDKALDIHLQLENYTRDTPYQITAFFQSISQIGIIYNHLKDYSAAITFLEKYLELSRSDSLSIRDRGTYLLVLSTSYLEHDDEQMIQRGFALHDTINNLYNSNNRQDLIYNFNIDRQKFALQHGRNDWVIENVNNHLDNILESIPLTLFFINGNATNLFNAYFNMGRYEEAREALLIIANHQNEIFTAYPEFEFFYLQNMAELERATNNCIKSIENFDMLFELTNWHPHNGISRLHKSRIDYDYASNMLFDYLKARRCFHSPKDLSHSILLDSLIDIQLFNLTMENSRVNLKREFSKYYTLMADIAYEKGDNDLMWYASEKSKNLLLLQNASKKKYNNQNQADSLKSLISQYNSDILSGEYASTRSTDDLERDSLDRLLAHLRFDQMQSIEALNKFEINNPTEVIPLKEVNDSEEEVILHYKYGDEFVYCLLYSPDTTISYRLGHISTIDSLVSELRNGLDAVDDITSHSYDLYELLWAPLNIESENVTLIPDAGLASLPWEVLCLDPLCREYLMEKHSLHYALSYSHLQVIEQDHAPSSFQVSIISPDYNEAEFSDMLASYTKSAEFDFKYLSHSKNEAKQIQELLKGELIEGDIEKSEFANRLTQSNVLHFTGHGHIDASNSVLSFLALTDEADQFESVLTSGEIEDMNTTTDLVVLNACNTGIGKVVNGEGVFSLARSFFKAGAKAVVNSLWSIDDQPSSEIMINFYKNLKQKHSKSEALRNAKLTYLQNAPDHRRHPYYWAGLIVVGDDSPIQFYSWYENVFLWLGIGVLLLIVIYLYRKVSASRT